MRLGAACLLACLLHSVVLAPPAAAALRAIPYVAEIWAVPAELSSIASVGDPVTGELRFDDATADAEPDPAEGYYPSATHEFTIGTYAGVSTLSFLRIYDDTSMPAFDAWQVGDFAPGDDLAPIAGLAVSSLFFVVNGGADLFASDAIPPGLPPFADPSVFEKEFRLEAALPGGGTALLRATIVQVPAPDAGAGAACAAATLAFVAMRRRRRLVDRPLRSRRVAAAIQRLDRTQQVRAHDARALLDLLRTVLDGLRALLDLFESFELLLDRADRALEGVEVDLGVVALAGARAERARHGERGFEEDVARRDRRRPTRRRDPGRSRGSVPSPRAPCAPRARRRPTSAPRFLRATSISSRAFGSR